MASIITVSLYAIRITPKRQAKSKSELPVDCFDGTHDLLDVFKAAFEKLHSSTGGLDEGNRRLTIPQPMNVDPKNRIMHGVLEVGGYGYGSSLRDKNGKEKYRRKPTDAEMVPLYARIWIPKGQSYAIVPREQFPSH